MLVFQFTYGGPVYKEKNPNCCKLLPILCWRHCLKTLKIKDFGGCANKKDLANYFFENAQTLESFQYFEGDALLKCDKDLEC
jgi:hypothetical protein